MTSLIFVCFVHGAGGSIFTPDLQVNVETDAFRNALEFYKAMREFCPPGATNYSWGDSLTAFVAGATATGIYTGRVLANVSAQNPRIADHISAHPYPTISTSVPHWTFNDFPSVMIPKGASNLDVTKRFAAHLFRADGYIRQLHAAPGHVLPVLKTIYESPAYQENALIKKYATDVQVMSQQASAGHNLVGKHRATSPTPRPARSSPAMSWRRRCSASSPTTSRWLRSSPTPPRSSQT